MARFKLTDRARRRSHLRRRRATVGAEAGISSVQALGIGELPPSPSTAPLVRRPGFSAGSSMAYTSGDPGTTGTDFEPYWICWDPVSKTHKRCGT